MTNKVLSSHSLLEHGWLAIWRMFIQKGQIGQLCLPPLCDGYESGVMNGAL